MALSEEKARRVAKKGWEKYSRKVVRRVGFEPTTIPVEKGCSSQLSYRRPERLYEGQLRCVTFFAVGRASG